MRQFHDENSKSWAGSFRAGLAMLTFGLGTLGYLVAIDHPEWFHLRPMTGAAVAMSAASDRGQDNAVVAREAKARPY